MMESFGIFYGVGVGPGDPEEITIRALKILRESEVIAAPTEIYSDSVAYRIVTEADPSLKEKDWIGLRFPMIRDTNKLDEIMKENAAMVAEVLSEGKRVAFVTLGDPGIYSTFFKVAPLVKKMGLETRVISGVPSFCSVSASFQEAIADRKEPIHIYPNVPEKQELPFGTTIFMKPGKNLPKLKEWLIEEERAGRCKVFGAEDCGMDGEKLLFSASEIPNESGYFITIIAKKK